MLEQKQTVVARMTAKPGRDKFVRKELIKLVEESRVEEGCITFNLHQDNVDDHVFLIYENWANYELLKKHMRSHPMAAFTESTIEVTQDFLVNEMTLI
ncbi:antibiotic biosynthesis monooxygenase [bacterium]|nr:antibiotic biosynthesis monooxygenase [bacterium]